MPGGRDSAGRLKKKHLKKDLEQFIEIMAADNYESRLNPIYGVIV